MCFSEWMGLPFEIVMDCSLLRLYIVGLGKSLLLKMSSTSVSIPDLARDVNDRKVRRSLKGDLQG
jgi:hypothetical protein